MLKYDSEIPITNELKKGGDTLRYLVYKQTGVWHNFENVPSTDVLVRARVYDNEWNNITSGSSITINGEAGNIKKLASGTSYTISITPPAGYAPIADITGITDNQPLIDYKLIAREPTTKARLMLSDGSVADIPFTGAGDTTINASEIDSDKDNLISAEVFEGVTAIGEGVFQNCNRLSSITLPDSVTSIGVGVFYNCSSLTAITIPSNVTSIGDWAFGGCYSLTSITLPDSVTTIGKNVFQYCSSLDSITCEATTPPTLGEGALGGIRNIYVPAASVDAFKTAAGWSTYADIIQPIP